MSKPTAAWFPQKEEATHFIHVVPTVEADGGVFCVNWEIFEVTGLALDKGDKVTTVTHGKRGSRSLYLMDRGEVVAAPPMFHGFCKWDGCMQWWAGDPLSHVDSMDAIISTQGALAAARSLCAEVLGEECDFDDEPKMPSEQTTEIALDMGGLTTWKGSGQ